MYNLLWRAVGRISRSWLRERCLQACSCGNYIRHCCVESSSCGESCPPTPLVLVLFTIMFLSLFSSCKGCVVKLYVTRNWLFHRLWRQVKILFHFCYWRLIALQSCWTVELTRPLVRFFFINLSTITAVEFWRILLTDLNNFFFVVLPVRYMENIHILICLHVFALVNKNRSSFPSCYAENSPNLLPYSRSINTKYMFWSVTSSRGVIFYIFMWKETI